MTNPMTQMISSVAAQIAPHTTFAAMRPKNVTLISTMSLGHTMREFMLIDPHSYLGIPMNTRESSATIAIHHPHAIPIATRHAIRILRRIRKLMSKLPSEPIHM